VAGGDQPMNELEVTSKTDPPMTGSPPAAASTERSPSTGGPERNQSADNAASAKPEALPKPEDLPATTSALDDEWITPQPTEDPNAAQATVQQKVGEQVTPAAVSSNEATATRTTDNQSTIPPAIDQKTGEQPATPSVLDDEWTKTQPAENLSATRTVVDSTTTNQPASTRPLESQATQTRTDNETNGPVDVQKPEVLGPGEWTPVKESMSERAKEYQDRVTGAPAGMGYKVEGVKFDGYSDGKLLDAKGPGYENFVKNERFMGWYNGADSLVSQAERQLRAAGSTPVEWRVAEPKAAVAMRNLFSDAGISGISIVDTP
jgi:Restriction endonuclease fold toxin 5